MALLTTRIYEGTFVRAVDGDTYELDFDYGFKSRQIHDVRLRGYDTPEKKHPKYEEAKNLAAFVMQGRPLLLTTYKRASGTYVEDRGRYLCDVVVVGEPHIGNLGEYLVSMGVALPWNGKGEHPWKEH